MATDIRELDRLAVDTSMRLVAGIAAGDLDRATPCDGWNLRALLEHMTVQHRGFARAATGVRSGVADWAPRSLGNDPAGRYAEAAAGVTAAFGAEGVLEREFWLPEIRADEAFPAPLAIGFHTLDYVTHSWDVAAALGAQPEFAPGLVEAVRPMAEQIPDTPEVRGPGGPFRRGVEVAADAPPLHRFLAALGRDPHWRAP